MPPVREDIDEDYDSDVSSGTDLVTDPGDCDSEGWESDSDEEWQEDNTRRMLLGRPRTRIYDAKEYVSEASGVAERSGLDAARLKHTNETWKRSRDTKVKTSTG